MRPTGRNGYPALLLAVLCAGGLVCALAAAQEPLDGGAVISVQVGDGGDTTLDVQRGEVKVRSGGKETRVAAGEGVQAGHGKPMKHLLRAPTNLSPSDGANVSSLDFTVRFDKVPGAHAYEVLVASDPQFSDIVWRADRAEGTKVEARVQKAGTYWWRVTALSPRSEVSGRASSPRKLVVDLTPPKLKAGQPRWK
jgi:hypothetical protein